MRRALVVRFSSLGDVVLASALVDPLLRAGYRPFLLTFRPYHLLFSDDPRLDVIPTTKEELFSVARSLGDFDLKIDLQKNLRSYALRLLLPGRWRSYPKESFRRRLSVFLPFLRKPYFVPQAYAMSLRGIVDAGEVRPRIVVSPERVERARRRFGDYVVIAPGARYEKKRYPYFGEVAKLFEREGIRVLVVGSAEERGICERVGGVNLCGELGLEEVLGVIAGARLFLGNDSGLLHCARAVGTKAVQIYGGTHPTLGFSLFPEEGEVICRCLPCQPCDVHGKGGCRRGDFACLDIPPKEVFDISMKLLKTPSG
ncbi:MAG: glycosyltransferase family 9 protein [Aquificae bacterium]|nr:glycosyltransferase family 9 protein [Aquificota bacterium]